MNYEKIINQMKEYAELNNIPIMMDEGISFLKKIIMENSVKNILEIGTAIGYSAIVMCSISEDICVTTIERDEKRYLEAIKNIKSAGLEKRIHLIYQDALEVHLEDKYDLIFIDAAKAQNQKFFERFEKNLNSNGMIVTDNMNFHGFVQGNIENIESRNLRQLVRKVRDYHHFLENNVFYKTQFFDIGDGIAVSHKIVN